MWPHHKLLALFCVGRHLRLFAICTLLLLTNEATSGFILTLSHFSLRTRKCHCNKLPCVGVIEDSRRIQRDALLSVVWHSTLQGKGISRNTSAGLSFLELCAETGHPQSQFALGVLYADVLVQKEVNQRGKNSSDAVRMLRRAALQVLLWLHCHGTMNLQAQLVYALLARMSRYEMMAELLQWNDGWTVAMKWWLNSCSALHKVWTVHSHETDEHSNETLPMPIGYWCVLTRRHVHVKWPGAHRGYKPFSTALSEGVWLRSQTRAFNKVRDSQCIWHIPGLQ